MRALYRRDPFLIWTLALLFAFGLGVLVGAEATTGIQDGLEGAMAALVEGR